MPFDQLAVQILKDFRSHEWRLGEGVLDLCSYFAKLDVLNQRNKSCVLTNNVLERVSEV